MGDGTTVSMNGSEPIPLDELEKRVDAVLGRKGAMDNLQISDIPGFQGLWDEAIEEVYKKLADREDGPHKIAVTAIIERKGVRMSGEEIIAAVATIQVKGPSPSKLQSQVVELIREDGTLKAMPQKQESLGLGT